MWYALRPCIFARFTSSRVFAEFFPPTTMIVFTCSASSLAACWRFTVTGQTVLKIFVSWAISEMCETSSLKAHGGCVDCDTTPAFFIRGSFSHSSFVSTTVASGAKPSRPTTSGCSRVPRMITR